MMSEALFQVQTSTYNKYDYSPEVKKTVPGTPRRSSISSIPTEFPKAIDRRGSFVVGQKLRESKWFTHEEVRVFCAVVETGFMVEKCESNENTFGIVIWVPGYEKSKDAHFLTIYFVGNKTNSKVVGSNLQEFWSNGSKIRIFNAKDKTDIPLSDETIRNQIKYAENTKRIWHNSEHFATFCRYGPVCEPKRKKLSEHLGWNFFSKFKSFSVK